MEHKGPAEHKAVPIVKPPHSGTEDESIDSASVVTAFIGVILFMAAFVFIYKESVLSLKKEKYSIEENPTWQTFYFHETLEIR